MGMKATDLQDAIGMVDPVLIARADTPAPIQKEQTAPPLFKRRPLRWTAAVAAVLVLAVCLGALFGHRPPQPPMSDDPTAAGDVSKQEGDSINKGDGTTTTTQTTTTTKKSGILDNLFPGLTAKAETLAQAEYPKMAPYPNERELGFEKKYDAWRADKDKQAAYRGAGEGLTDFFRNSTATFLRGAGAENRAYSPLNVYMALAVLAEIADGTSRQQVLDLLGADSLTALREQARAVWNANYSNDGAEISVLGSSLWLNEGVAFNKETLNTLTDYYYASSYRGEMGTAGMDKALRNWLNEQTGGLLKEQVEGITTDPNTVMTLLTTIYFRAKWTNWFSADKTASDTFHGVAGDVTCPFMNRTESWGTYYWGDRFSASSLALEGQGTMWFVLPDEGVSVEELLADEQAMDFVLASGKWDNQKSLKVNFSVPRFDIESQLDLKEGLQSLGIADCFDRSKANFNPLTTTTEVWLDKVQHGVRVAIDEEGVTAAAYTEMTLCGSAMPPDDEVDFVLDRPFLFVVTGADQLPLFIGVVNQP